MQKTSMLITYGAVLFTMMLSSAGSTSAQAATRPWHEGSVAETCWPRLIPSYCVSRKSGNAYIEPGARQGDIVIATSLDYDAMAEGIA